MTPIEMMLERVEWEALPVQPPGELPHATHAGVLTIGDYAFPCHILSDGRRVIDCAALVRFFEGFYDASP